MIDKCLYDGQEIEIKEIEELKQEGFDFDDKDFTRDLKVRNKRRLDFVGFLYNNEKILPVFPKNFESVDHELDLRKIFRVINKHKKTSPGTYFGPKGENNIKSNYPFSTFFSIYDYYRKYGVHFKQKNYLKPYGTGKVNWKETIRLSQKFILEENLIMLPIYHNQNKRIDTFLSDCMIFVIDHTIETFHLLIQEEKTNKPFPKFDFLKNKNFVIQNLQKIKNKTYRDIHIKLINDLIDFFDDFNETGEKYYLKHYSFYNIWEDMIKEYLNRYFLKFEDGKMVLSDSELNPKNNFLRPSEFKFTPNDVKDKVKRKWRVEPDFYLEKDGAQIILDAKYKKIKELDYKQISYLLFLKNQRKNVLSKKRLFSKTHSALITPSNKNNTGTTEHFKMDPIYNKECSDFEISEERLDIYKIINVFINT